ncbi:MAG: mechanosensitive ion channel family protein [Fimbriimonadaceae bacterium]|nr:mechanosensitive ion channel family protein [Fimbriimonadaceae bacterium]
MIPLAWLSQPKWLREIDDIARGFGPDQAFGVFRILLFAACAYGVGFGLAALAIKLSRRFSGQEIAPRNRRSIRGAAGLLTATWWADQLLAFGPFNALQRTVLNSLTDVMSLIGAGWLAFALWDTVCDAIIERTGNQRAERLLIPVTRKLVRVLIVSVAAIVSLSIFGVNIAGIVAGLGIGGIVVALAAKDSVENVFGSVTILFDTPFKLGDWVRIDKIEGVVEEINLRSTRIRTFEDTLITLPNANLIRASVENFGARRSRRQRVTMRLPYGNPPDGIEAWTYDLRSYLAEQSEVTPDRSIVAISEVNDGGVVVLIQTYFEVESQAEELELRQRLVLHAIERANARGLSFAAAPTVVVNPPIDRAAESVG